MLHAVGVTDQAALSPVARPRSDADGVGPDGCEVRSLVTTTTSSTEHRTLGVEQATVALVRPVDEIWWFVQGRARVWRSNGTAQEVADVGPSTAVAVPAGTAAQVQNVGDGPVRFVAVTPIAADGLPGGEPRVVEGRW